MGLSGLSEAYLLLKIWTNEIISELLDKFRPKTFLLMNKQCYYEIQMKKSLYLGNEDTAVG